jgi:hypothetical protein
VEQAEKVNSRHDFLATFRNCRDSTLYNSYTEELANSAQGLSGKEVKYLEDL